MSILSKEAMLYDVYTSLARVLNKRIEPVACREDEYLLIIDKRWKLHLTREDLDELHDAISSDPGSMRDAFDAMKIDKLEFLSFERR